MKLFNISIVSLAVAITSSIASGGTYSGGSGLDGDAYKISTVADWQELMNTPADWDKHFILTADLDFQGASLTPVGSQQQPFTGDFNGYGHILHNWVIDQPKSDYVGLFGDVGSSGATIRGLGLEDFSVSGHSYVGGLVGRKHGTVTSCYATGSVSGFSEVGGLVGTNSGTVTGCYATGSVSGKYDSVGGLVGYNRYGHVTSCYATGDVTGSFAVGGLVAFNDGQITSCYATGDVTGSSHVGGLVGQNINWVSRCYATGSVSGTSAVGGLVGYNAPAYYDPEEQWGQITSCFATGDVTGSSYVGGLVGNNDGEVRSSYATGSVSAHSDVGGLVGVTSHAGVIIAVVNCYATGSVSGGGDNVGGLVGSGSKVRSSFWDVQTSGQMSSAAGWGLSSAEMKDAFFYSANGWAGDEWTIAAGDYPHLAWENVEGALIADPNVDMSGSGKPGNPWTIESKEDLLLVGSGTFFWDKHYRLGADIDLSGTVYNRGLIGHDYDNPFTGSFDGNGHVIRNLTIEGASCLGLFGYVGQHAVLTSLGAENVSITGTGDNVGGLVGESRGTMTSCFATGSVSGGGYNVGGLVGLSNGRGMVTNCYATGSVSGSADYVGGLVGQNSYYNRIINCYAAGSVSGGSAIGGLVGYTRHNSEISSSYATGDVTGSSDVGGLVGRNEGAVSSSFWDTETSSLAVSAGGEGKTTAQMQDINTYLDAGWDFATVWSICDGTNYPRLTWQIPPADWLCPDGVGMEDLAHLTAQWLRDNCETTSDCQETDLNKSGSVDFADVAAFAKQWADGT